MFQGAGAVQTGKDEIKSRITIVGGLPNQHFDHQNLAKATAEKAEQQRKAAWENPEFEILEDSRGDLPEFPTDVFSPVWKSFIKRAAHGAGVTEAHVAVPLLSVVSGLIGCSYRIKASGSWFEACSFWSAIVGYSGIGKTPGIDVSTRALNFIDKNRQQEIAELQRKHETRVEEAKASLKQWKKEVEEAVEAGQNPPLQPASATMPGPFTRPRIWVSDATIERLAVLLQARPSGMIVMYDELAGLFSNMSRYSSGSDREFWLQAWNGNAHVVERMGRDPVLLDHLLITVVGGLQPDKLKRSFDGDNDGMYARVGFCWPSEPGYRPLSKEAVEHDSLLLNVLKRLVELPITTEEGLLVSSSIQLSAEAEEEFEKFRRFHMANNGGLYGREREWWAKGQSHVLRLAGTMAFMDWAIESTAAKPTQIEARFITAAVRLWLTYFWPHSRSALRQIGLTDDQVSARRALQWIKANKADDPVVSVQDIRRHALAHSLDAKKTEVLLAQLENAGWLRKDTTATRGRSVHRWHVNEKLFSLTPMQKVQGVQEAPHDAEAHPLSALTALPAPGNGNGHSAPPTAPEVVW